MRSIVLAGLVLGLLAGPLMGLFPGAQAQVGLIEPGLQGAVHYDVGDFWKYKQVPTPARKPNTVSDFEIYVRELSGVTFRLAGEEVLRQAWRMKWFVNTSSDVSAAADTFGTDTLKIGSEQDRWFLHIDDPGWPLAEAKSKSEFNSNTPAQPEWRSDAEYRPPLASYVFPFGEGDEWVTITKRWNTDYQQCQSEPPCNSQTPLEYQYTVLRQEKVKIEYGPSKFNGKSYDAWVIKKLWLNAAGERYYVLWYVPEFCGHVKLQEYHDTTGDNQGLQLTYTEWIVDGKCSQKVPETQPIYELGDPKNFSTTRFHGKIVLPDEPGHGDEGGNGGSGSGKTTLLQKLPAVGVAPLVLVAVGLAALRRRREA